MNAQQKRVHGCTARTRPGASSPGAAVAPVATAPGKGAASPGRPRESLQSIADFYFNVEIETRNILQAVFVFQEGCGVPRPPRARQACGSSGSRPPERSFAGEHSSRSVHSALVAALVSPPSPLPFGRLSYQEYVTVPQRGIREKGH